MCGISSLSCQKPLFVTEEGFNLYEGMNFWYTNSNYMLRFWEAKKMSSYTSNYEYLKDKPKFHHETACKRYIEENREEIIGGNLLQNVKGDLKLHVNGNLTWDVDGNIIINSGGTQTNTNGGNYTHIAPRIDLNP